MSKTTDRFLAIAVILILLLLAYLVVGCSYGAYTTRDCLKAGYPETAFTLDFKTYCISWIDATKVVVPLADIR